MNEDDESMFDLGINSILVVYRCGCRDGMRDLGPLQRGPRCTRYHESRQFDWTIEWPLDSTDD